MKKETGQLPVEVALAEVLALSQPADAQSWSLIQIQVK